MELRRAVDAHNGDMEAQNGALEGRVLSQWRHGSLNGALVGL
jgi:hypothetical protein